MDKTKLKKRIKKTKAEMLEVLAKNNCTVTGALGIFEEVRKIIPNVATIQLDLVERYKNDNEEN